ncbi:MAG: prepilin peptidase dependent protein A [Paraglaciecola sp.]|nr:prepilin peptidase dependent protein A [Paraglaciecola sp.]NCT47901.1 prepilin peptidase dependent protein A [Paraglaciecola sp.]
MHQHRALSLLELLFTIAITTLVLTLGVPTFLGAQKTMQLKGAAELSYFLLQQARSQAISRRQAIATVFQAGSNWCIALSDAGACDCQVAGNCLVSGVEHKIAATDFRLVHLDDIRFGADRLAIFDGVRGLAIGNAGSTIISDGDNALKLIVSNMGRVRLCVARGAVSGYKPC